jgi:hypothetical protein
LPTTKTNPRLSQNRVLLPISLRLLYIHRAYLSSNSIYTSVSVMITTTITTHLAIMACTLPCLKQFLAMFESGMIGEYSDSGSGSGMNTTASGYGYTGGSGYGSGSRKGSRIDRSGSVALVEIARGGHGTVVTNASQAGGRYRPATPTSDNSSDKIELNLRPDHAVGDYSVASVSTATAADASSFVSDRSGAAMIIKKTRKWEVSRDER